MMRMFTLDIFFTDGTGESVQHVNNARIIDGVLSLWEDRPYSGGYKHLGSYPLANIRKWTRVEE